MIAVTGATGLLGRHILHRLAKDAQPVVALSRDPEEAAAAFGASDRVTWRFLDLMDPATFESALEGVDGVIHAGGLVTFVPERNQTIMEVNASGTRHLVDACVQRGIKRFVHVSSIATLGRPKGKETIDEECRWSAEEDASVYAESKYLAELEVFRAEAEGLNAVVINPSVILSDAVHDRSSGRLFGLLSEEHWFSSRGVLNYVDARDVAEVAVLLYHSDVRGDRFIVNGGIITLEEFMRRAAALMQVRAPGIFLSKRTLLVVAAVARVIAWLTRTEPLITSYAVRMAHNNVYYANDKLRKRLKFEFKPIEETLQWCCASQRQRKE